MFEGFSKRKFKFNKHPIRITATLHENLLTFMVISHGILFRKRNTSDKIVDNIKMHILYSIHFPENCGFCEIMWKNNVMKDRPYIII